MPLLLIMLLLCSITQAQVTITGKVTDELTNEPIPFANIVIQNTTTGTTTGAATRAARTTGAAGTGTTRRTRG